MDIKQKVSVDGKLVSVIATYNDEESGKNFIIYTDDTKNDDGKLNVFYGTYTLEGDNPKISSIDSKEDAKIVLEIIKTVVEQKNRP